MGERRNIERTVFRVVVAILALLPTLTGAAGIAFGPTWLGLPGGHPVDLDSHVRFLSAIFFAMGLGWYSCLPDLDASTGRFRLLAVLTIAGGIGRLVSALAIGTPTTPHMFGLGMELVVVPLLLAWHRRVVSRA